MRGRNRREALEIVSEAVEGWLAEGATEDEALERLAWLADVTVDWEAIGAAIGLPWSILGARLEAVDDALALKALKALERLVKSLQPDPVRLRKRAEQAEEKGRLRLAARRRLRAKRIEEKAN